MTEKMKNDNNEKQFDEKAEKELRKHDEKVERRDALSSMVWAAILIWAGLVFLAANTGRLDRYLVSGFLTPYLSRGLFFFEPSVWSLIMLGAGIILVFEVIARLSLPNFWRHVGGTLITAAVFTGIGLGNMFGWDIVWPVILIAVGISILLGNYLRKKNRFSLKIRQLFRNIDCRIFLQLFPSGCVNINVVAKFLDLITGG